MSERDEPDDLEEAQEAEDRAAILARRARFIATTLAGLTGLAACDVPPRGGPDAGATSADDAGAPLPCLSFLPPPEPPPAPCLSQRPPDPDAGTPPPPPPHPCLKPVRPTADAGPPPAPCLRKHR